MNDKVYIGQSTSIIRRWKEHIERYDDEFTDQYNSVLYRSMRKYGIECFTFRILELCNEDDLDAKEKYWISYLDATNPQMGYNISAGGKGSACGILLNKVLVEKIKDELSNSNISQKEIADRYDVTQSTISLINTGEIWFEEELDYPLRKQHFNGYSIKFPPKQFLCLDCGAEISRGAIRCSSCSRKLPKIRSINSTYILMAIPEKDELYNNLLSEKGNFTKVSKLYGVTDNAVRKWCKKYSIPYKSSDYKT